MPPPRNERDPAQAKRIGRPKGAPNRRQQSTRTRTLPEGTEPRDLSLVEHTFRNPVPASHHRQRSLDRAQLETQRHRDWQATRQQERDRLAVAEGTHDGRVTTPDATQDHGFDASPSPLSPLSSSVAEAMAAEASRKRPRAPTVQTATQSAPAAAEKIEAKRLRDIKKMEDNLAALRAQGSPP